MNCKKCGSEIKNGEKFCCSCGTPIDGATEIKFHKKFRKVVPFLIGICVFCASTGTLLAKGNSDNLPLLEQIEKKYELNVPGIAAAGGRAVDNVVLEDYLPYEGYQRNTTIVNSTDETENLYEEMTMYIEDGKSKYSIYNYLVESTVYGEMVLDDSGEYYYTQQENWWNASALDTEVYIGLPEKAWTKQNGSDETKIFIAPEFYTVDTPYGTYENCLLKYEHTAIENNSLKGSNTFTAYAPYGVGKVYSVMYAEDSQEVPLTYYTYIPEDSYSNWGGDSVDTDISQDAPDDGMMIADIMDDEASDLWTSGNGTSALTLAMRLESGEMHVYLFSVHAMEILYSGVIGTTTADEIYIIGDSEYGEGKIVYLSDNELELTVDGEVYVFNIL